MDWQIVGLIGEKCGRIYAQIQLDINENRAILINPTPLDVTLMAMKTMAFVRILFKRAYQDWSAGNTKMNSIPQALNLQAIEQGISFTKGCYIGQETVARAKYRGANKRAMYVLSGETTGDTENR